MIRILALNELKTLSVLLDKESKQNLKKLFEISFRKILKIHRKALAMYNCFSKNPGLEEDYMPDVFQRILQNFINSFSVEH